jgi:hypothetical protein
LPSRSRRLGVAVSEVVVSEAAVSEVAVPEAAISEDDLDTPLFDYFLYSRG